jgi:hypothetical protein
MQAMFSSEERYADLTIFFDTENEKNHICSIAHSMLNEMDNIEASIFVKSFEEDIQGEVHIEFADDYDKEAGHFIDEISKKLSLEFIMCDIID